MTTQIPNPIQPEPTPAAQNVYLGFLRHLLTMGGGVLITKGYADEATVTALVGATMTFIGFGWSYWVKK